MFSFIFNWAARRTVCAQCELFIIHFLNYLDTPGGGGGGVGGGWMEEYNFYDFRISVPPPTPPAVVMKRNFERESFCGSF